MKKRLIKLQCLLYSIFILFIFCFCFARQSSIQQFHESNLITLLSKISPLGTIIERFKERNNRDKTMKIQVFPHIFFFDSRKYLSRKFYVGISYICIY